jgi:hypothetical protein
VIFRVNKAGFVSSNNVASSWVFAAVSTPELNRPGFSSVFYTRMELCGDSIRKSSENAPSAW